DSRRYLQKEWFASENLEQFKAANRRLVAYYDDLLRAAKPEESVEWERMYHLIGADPPSGFSEFERLCRRERERLRYGKCEALIALAREYQPILTPLLDAKLSYHSAKLAYDLRDWKQSAEAFDALL